MRINYSPSFDPMEKIITLYEEKAALLERLVTSEQENWKSCKNKMPNKVNPDYMVKIRKSDIV